MEKEKITFSKEIVKSFDLFTAILIGLFGSFILYMADSANFLGTWKLDARLLGFLRTALMTGAGAFFLCMFVLFGINTPQKKVTIFDYLSVIVCSFGFGSLGLELFLGENTQVFGWYIWAVVAVVSLVLILLRNAFVCEENEIPFGGKKYYAAVAYRFDFVALAVVGVALGLVIGGLCANMGINTLIDYVIPGLAEIPNYVKYGALAAVIAAVFGTIILSSILTNIRTKVNFVDAFLVIAQIALLSFSVYFAPRMGNTKPMFVMFYIGLVAVVFITTIIRSLFIDSNIVIKNEKPSTKAYYHEVARTYSITLLTAVGVALSYLLVNIDLHGLANLFASENVVTTVISICMTCVCLIAALVSIFRGEVVSKKVEFIDALLYIAVSGGLSGIVVLFTSFSWIKIAIWAVLFAGVVAFVIARIFHVVPELTPVVEEPVVEETEEVEEETEEVVEETEEVVQEQTEEVIQTVEEDDEAGFRSRYIKSFLARLNLADDEDYDFYNALKNHILTYKVKSRISWNYESFNAGRRKLIKLNVRGKTLVMYIALDPAKYENTKYNIRNVSDSKKFEQTPVMVKVKSNRGLKFAIELVDALMAELEIKLNKKAVEEDYRPERKTFEELIQMGLIKDLEAEVNPFVPEAPAKVEEPVAPVIENDDDDEEEQENEAFRARYKKSFEAKLTLASEESHEFYNTIKNHLLTYKVKSRLSWNYESFNAGRKKLAKINVRGKTLVIYLALDPVLYENTKYNFRNVSDSKKFAETPMMLKVRSNRGVKYALELIDIMMSTHGIKNNAKATQENYHPVHRTFEELIELGLIKDLGEGPVGVFNIEPKAKEETVEVQEVEDPAFINARYKKSYLARLTLSDDNLLDKYNQIKNLLLSYKSKARISWGLESFNIGRKKIAKINVRGKSISLYLALDPESVDAKYHAKNVSESKRFAETPVLIKVKSPRSLKYAFELIESMMASLERVKRDLPQEDYRPERKSLEELVECGLVKDKLAQQ